MKFYELRNMLGITRAFPLRKVGLTVILIVFVSLHGRLLAINFGGESDITAVSARTSKDYVRARTANGLFVPESYAFGEGGIWKGAKPDTSIDKLKFLDVAHTIAAPLLTQNYIPGKTPKNTKLLIMVYWGTTHAPEHASSSGGYVNLQNAQGQLDADRMENVGKQPTVGKGQPATITSALNRPGNEQLEDEVTTAIAAVAAENHMRDQEDLMNANMLGFDSWWEETQKFKGTPLDIRRQDLLDEIEEDRYFVVLMAYDFQLLWKQKVHKLLWETRFSIRQRHHEFDKDLPSMAQYASQYFGEDSGGLVHKEIPLGHVEIGAVKSLGEAPGK